MDNKVDGIQKVKIKDVVKSRKMVLDSIAEETRRMELEQEEKKQKPKKIDGISFVKTFKKEVKKIKQLEEPHIAPDFKQDEDYIESKERKETELDMKKKKDELARRLHEERLRKEELANSKREEEEKKIETLRLQKEREEKMRIQKENEEAERINQIRILKEKKEAEKIRLEKEEEERKKQEKEKEHEIKIAKEREKERIRQQEIKIKQDKIRKKEEEKAEKKREKEEKKKEAILQKEREKIKKQKGREQKAKAKILKRKKRAEWRAEKVKLCKEICLRLFSTWKKSLRLGFRKFFYIFSISILLIILFYFIFIILVIQFKIDSKFSRLTSKFFPVPALISRGSIVDYYQYKDFKNSISDRYNDEEELSRAAKTLIVEKMVLDELAMKYSVSDFDKIKENYIFDADANQVAFNRITKIKEMIKDKDDFVRIAVKYGDEQGKLDYNSSDEAALKFGEKIKDLEVGEVSGVLIGKDGYYIARRYEKNGSNFPISYVLIKTRTLEEYLNRTALGSKIWSLVD